jgi:HD-GYP domain-containing protein (c-di-GMP phosphodiesterase class II)
MISLGLAALLHDIGIRKNYGIITPDTKITDIINSKIQLHPSESSFFAQRINTDVFVQRAIYEHHEYLDGSGYPRGIMRYMSKFSPILTFAERFSELVLNNPFIPKPLPPAIAINHILKNEINKFDKDVVFAFIRGTSVYPIGSWVELSNGTIGLVSNISPKDKSKQIIKCVFTSDLKKLSSPTYIDLAENPDVKITRILNPIELSMKVGDLRVYYFD